MALEAVTFARRDLREVLWLANHLLNDTNESDAFDMAPAIWTEMQSTLESLLVRVGEMMEVPPDLTEEEDVPSQRPQTVQCWVCMTRLPTIALRSCGHLICPVCSRRVHRCPICRRPIVGRLRLYM